MPYTLSNAIVSLPVSLLSKGKIPLIAIIVGSVSPDLPYLLALTPTQAPGHSLHGVLIYCLVPSLLLLSIWYRWLEQPTLDLLWLPQRPQAFAKQNYFLIIIGVLLGAYSHVLWDATSHSYGMFVTNSEFWKQKLLSLPLYKWNQYASGVIGLIILLIWYCSRVLRNRHNPYKGYLGIALAVYISNIVFFIALANIIHESDTIAEYTVRSAIGIISGFTIGTCLYAAIINLKNH